MIGAIANPARLAAVRALADRGSATLPELASAAGVHPNTMRRHLAALEREEVIARVNAPGRGRGRPKIAYRLTDDWSQDAHRASGMAELLAALVQRLDPSAEETAEFGRQWGRYLAARPGGRDAPGTVRRALERLGFDVERNGEMRLRACPCPVVSPDRPELICKLAVAAAEGALSAADEGLRVHSVHHDPARRSCGFTIGAGSG
jgi:predicted ArsR family transcriptional regulator